MRYSKTHKSDLDLHLEKNKYVVIQHRSKKQKLCLSKYDKKPFVEVCHPFIRKTFVTLYTSHKRKPKSNSQCYIRVNLSDKNVH